jgi:hypothetical protein
MDDRSRKPAKRTLARRAEAPKTPARCSGETKLDRVCKGIDIAVTRVLALATAVAVMRGQVTPEVAAALYAVLLILRITGPGR